MQMMNIINLVTGSRLMLPRGLKYSIYIAIQEISMSRLMLPRGLKFVTADLKGEKKMSRLMLPRGLKYIPPTSSVAILRRGLCCLVD
ncbi:hypothetical protein HMPREF1548_06381 [Clostridium sp. KLE 1755]|nr:hypothetical protein HMPREF1548_06381 [Clostridium sp. KLE 1755]